MAAACSIGDLVHVRWGTGKGVSFEAVVHEQSEKGIRVCIDGPDERHPLSGCAIWLEADRIRPLPAPSKLPEWASEGCRVRALNPTADDESWDEATILVSRQGVKRGEAGVRFQVKFAGGTTAWVRFGDIAQPSTQVATSAPPLSLPPPMVSATETDAVLAQEGAVDEVLELEDSDNEVGVTEEGSGLVAEDRGAAVRSGRGPSINSGSSAAAASPGASAAAEDDSVDDSATEEDEPQEQSE